jgi:DNA repair protein RadC
VDEQKFLIRDVPSEERPRERMLQYGAAALNHSELLAILLRTGTIAESAIHVAQRIIRESGGLRHLASMSVEELIRIKGIGAAKALQIKAGLELGKRVAKSSFGERLIIRSPEDVSSFMMEELRYELKEKFVTIFLNTKNHIISHEVLSIGSLNSTVVHPREVFRAAIQKSSSAIICVHNHPSGDPTPSSDDIEMTRRLKEAGAIVGIDVLDHVIIGDQTFVSLKEQGLM